MTSGSRASSDSDRTPPVVIARPAQKPAATPAPVVEQDVKPAASEESLILSRKFVILLVEDDPSEKYLLERALKGMKIKLDLRAVEDGEAALNYLFHKKQFSLPASAPRPDLVLLDLNLPKVTGREVLATVRHHPETASIAFLVLSNSASMEEIKAIYRLGANSYLVKPANVQNYSELAQSVERFWFNTAALPSKP